MFVLQLTFVFMLQCFNERNWESQKDWSFWQPHSEILLHWQSKLIVNFEFLLLLFCKACVLFGLCCWYNKKLHSLGLNNKSLHCRWQTRATQRLSAC